MDVAITAIGTANPPYKRSQQETAEIIIAGLNLKSSERRLLRSIYKMAGIQERYSVLSDFCKLPGEFDFFPNNHTGDFPSTAQRMQVYQQNALAVALAAINDCYNLRKINFEEITHVITVSCTGMYAPGLDIELIQQLNLKTTVQRVAINFMGCYGAFNAIKVADHICKATNNAKVLIVCIEFCTIHFQNKMDIPNIISNAIFADGAAAILIEKRVPQTKGLVLNSFHCDIIPQSNKAMTWQISNTGFDIILSSYLPELLESGIKKFNEAVFANLKSSLSDISFFAIHPGGLKILQACEKAFGISEHENRYSYDVLKNYGNMSSPTVLFLLKKIWQELSISDQGKLIFSSAFGPGLTFESMLLQIQY